MSYPFNNEQKMNDIIFAHRNRSYGAYEIRSSYGNTVFRALSYMSLGFGTMFSLAFYFTRPKPALEKAFENFTLDSVYTVKVDLEKKLPAEPPKAAAAVPPASDAGGKSIGTFVNDTLSVETSTTETNVLSTVASTLAGIPGGTGTSTAATAATLSTGTGTVITEKTRTPLEVDEMPEFEGGLKGLKEWIASHTVYPQEAIEKGESGTIYVRFIVDEKGYVAGAELLNKKDEDLNREALRVVSAIPKFKSPGKVKGEPVSTYYQVPIRFMLK